MTIEYTPVFPLSSSTPVVGSTGTFSGQLIGGGTTTNDNASAGQIGEIISSTVAVGSAVSLTTAAATTITSISLTAGDWDVSFAAMFGGDTTTLLVYSRASLSATTNTENATPGFYAGHSIPTTVNVFNSGITYITENIGPVRVSLAATATYYLVVQVSFSGGAVNGFGHLRARRVR